METLQGPCSVDRRGIDQEIVERWINMLYMQQENIVKKEKEKGLRKFF